MPDDTEKLLTEIRDLLRANTEIALRNESRIENNLKAQQRIIGRFGLLAFFIVLTLGLMALWILYQIASANGLFGTPVAEIYL